MFIFNVYNYRFFVFQSRYHKMLNFFYSSFPLYSKKIMKLLSCMTIVFYYILSIFIDLLLTYCCIDFFNILYLYRFLHKIILFIYLVLFLGIFLCYFYNLIFYKMILSFVVIFILLFLFQLLNGNGFMLFRTSFSCFFSKNCFEQILFSVVLVIELYIE